MRYLIAGLIIGGVAGQMWGYAVAGQHPLRVEVPVIGDCQLPPQVARMQELVDRMPLAITVTEPGTMPEPVAAPRPRAVASAKPQVDEIGLLIAMGARNELP